MDAKPPVGVDETEIRKSASPEHPAPSRRRETLLELEQRRHHRIQSAALAVLATGAVLTLMYVAKPVLVVVLVSVLIAFALAPIADFCERMLRLPRSVGAMFAVLAMLFALYAVTWASYTRAVDFVQQLPKYSGELKNSITLFRQHAERLQQSTESVLPPSKEDKGTVHIRQTSNWTDWITQGALNLTEIFVMASFVPFLVFFMLSWQNHVRSSTVMLFRLENRHAAYTTLGLISQMIRSFITGNLLIGIITSALSAIVFGMLGVPYFYFIAVLSGFLSIVPYLGVVLAILPPVAASIGNLKGTNILIIVLTVLGLHLFSLNVLYPKIIGKRLQMNPLAVTIALLFWGWLWGAMGLILAVPLTAAIKIIFDHVDSLRPVGRWMGE
jgi:predicted PurR-regulated permease PerM